ncbi:MAG: hypothetical protein HUJ54_07060 [Erysipelotrichaceae bacterium]|nr:hypothetical protein [Erysipelotrichaceae bacterium]
MNNPEKSKSLVAITLIVSSVTAAIFFGFCLFQYFQYQDQIEKTAQSLSADKLSFIIRQMKDGTLTYDENFPYSFEPVELNGAHGYLVFREKGGAEVSDVFESPAVMLGFSKNLKSGEMTSAAVQNEKGRFLVTGTLEEIKGQNYHIIYYLEQSGFQDVSGFLKSRDGWIFSAGLTALLFILICCYIAHKTDLARSSQARLEKENLILTERMASIARKEEELPNVRQNIWEENMLAVFLKKIRERSLSPCTMVKIRFDSAKQRTAYIHHMAVYFNPWILRFLNRDKNLTLLMIGYDEQQARRIFDQMKGSYADIQEVRRVDDENSTGI